LTRSGRGKLVVRAPPHHADVHMATSPEVVGLACAEMIEQPPVLIDMLVGYISRGPPHLRVYWSAREREVEASRLRESLRRAVPLVPGLGPILPSS